MNEALQQSLYDKLSREQDKYRDWLKGQPPEEILHHSYEYTVREDILMSMEELTLSEAETRALLLSPSPMAMAARGPPPWPPRAARAEMNMMMGKQTPSPVRAISPSAPIWPI